MYHESASFQELGGGHTRQEDVEVSPTQSRISPSLQRILRKTIISQENRLLEGSRPVCNAVDPDPITRKRWEKSENCGEFTNLATVAALAKVAAFKAATFEEKSWIYQENEHLEGIRPAAEM